jgi:hypothetical protein
MCTVFFSARASFGRAYWGERMRITTWGWIPTKASVARRAMLAGVVALLAAGALSAAQATGAPAGNFRWFAARPAPPAWRVHALPAGAGFLFSPRRFKSVTDRDGVSLAVRNRHGTIVEYLNATPKQGPESLSNWPTYRLHVIREESNAVHEDGHAFGLSFAGGKGSCVSDDYLTRVIVHHYREIACFVRGRTAASVVVVAALRSDWTKDAPTLKRALEAYQVI